MKLKLLPTFAFKLYCVSFNSLITYNTKGPVQYHSLTKVISENIKGCKAYKQKNATKTDGVAITEIKGV